jgi:hypothetical protein
MFLTPAAQSIEAPLIDLGLPALDQEGEFADSRPSETSTVAEADRDALL